jgi:hypothetical protein
VKLLNEQPIRLQSDPLEQGGVGRVQDVKQVFPEQRLASCKTQGADAHSADLVHKFDRVIGVDGVLPP